MRIDTTFDIPVDELVAKAAAAQKKEVSEEEEPSVIAVEGDLQLALFRGKQIRQVFHGNEWFFSIVDVIEAITESPSPRRYWAELKKQLSQKEGYSELLGNTEQLKMVAADGKSYATESVNVETLFRIIQSIPSPKAEPFKRWLAKVGYERIEEFQNPEIGVKRAILNWQIQGRTDDWIEARLRSIVVRHELTSEWSRRGVKEGQEYGYLTNIISKKTFGLKTDDHKKLKHLTSQNLRDHMTDLELVFTMLGEKSTSAIAQATDSQGLEQNAESASSGGTVAGDARKELEKKLGRSIISSSNFLTGPGRVNDPKKLSEKKTQ